MSGMQRLFMGYGSQLIIVDSADFDGTNDYMTTAGALTGEADGKSGTLSAFIRLDGDDASFQNILRNRGGTNPPGFSFGRNASNDFSINGRNAAGTLILQLDSSASYAAGATWYHVLASWDLANGLGHLYVNGVSDLDASTLTDDTIDYTLGTWAFGAEPTVNKFNGCAAEVWFAMNVYTDFSIPYYRAKWASVGNKPVYLGTDGSAPNGTAPILYFHLADAEAVANFATNRGTGGDFSITGTLTDGSTTPSD